MVSKMDYQYFSNEDIIIETYKGLYLDNLNNFHSKNQYIKIKTNKKIKIYINQQIIDLTNLNMDEYYLISKNNNLIIEYDDKKYKIEYETKYKDIDLYCLELNIILKGSLFAFDCDLKSEIKDINEAKILFKKLVCLRKNIGKFKRYCYHNGYIFNNEITDKFYKILLNTKGLLNLFTNDSYYYDEFKNIIKNSKLPDNKYSISIVQKNMDLLDKIFKNYNNKIKTLEEPIQKLAKDFKNEECLEQYFSPIAQTNWLDSLQENQFAGLIIRTKPNKNFIFSKNINEIEILNITRSTIDLDMFFSFMNQYYKKNLDYDFGTNQPLIKGNGLGEGNCLIPIYINPVHWKLANKFIPLFTALATTINPGLFIKHSLYVYHHIMITMLRDTFKNKTLDDKWLNMLITIVVSTYEVNKMCDKINWDEFINDSNKRLYNNITSISQLLGQLFIDGIEMYKNDKEKLYKIFQLVFEECLRRIKPFKFTNKSSYFVDILNDNYDFINFKNDISDKINEYQLLNGTILGILLFDKLLAGKTLKEYIKDFINNDSLLLKPQIDEIKNFVKDNTGTFELIINKINYLINPIYLQHEIISSIKSYPIDMINIIFKKYFDKDLITENELKCMLIQNNIQANEKSRRIAIEKNKYYNPYLNYEKIMNSCHEYYKKRIIYETIENIKNKEELLNSDFYKFYQNDKYKNILNEFIKNNKLIEGLLNSI
jgi:hypothetical protein